MTSFRNMYFWEFSKIKKLTKTSVERDNRIEKNKWTQSLATFRCWAPSTMLSSPPCCSSRHALVSSSPTSTPRKSQRFEFQKKCFQKKSSEKFWFFSLKFIEIFFSKIFQKRFSLFYKVSKFEKSENFRNLISTSRAILSETDQCRPGPLPYR